MESTFRNNATNSLSYNATGSILKNSCNSPREETGHGVLFVVYICYIPLICVSNFFIIAATYLVKLLQSPHDCIVAGLAVADFLVGAVSIPIYLVIAFNGGLIRAESRNSCSLSWLGIVVPQELSLFIVFTMVVNRFVALNVPLWYRSRVRNKHVIAMLLLLYLVYILWAVLIYVVLFNYDEECPLSERCQQINTPWWYNEFLMASYQALFLVISFCLCINIIYITNKRNRQLSSASTGLKDSQNNYVNVTLAVSLVFIFLWLPTILGSIFQKTILAERKEYVYYEYFSQVLRLTNTLINAPIYAISRKKYRSVYKKLLSTPVWRWHREGLASKPSSLQNGRFTYSDKRENKGPEITNFQQTPRLPSLEISEVSHTTAPLVYNFSSSKMSVGIPIKTSEEPQV